MRMPFSNYKKKKDPQKSINELEHLTNHIRMKRVLSFVTHRRQASLTIETALVLPIFVFAMILLLMVSDALCLHVNIQRALHQNAIETAMSAYSERQFDEDALFAKVVEDIGTTYLDKAPIDGGSVGIDFSESKIMQRDLIDITADYNLQFPYRMFGIEDIPMRQTCVVHAWVGYGDVFDEIPDETGEQIVYITPYGSVYHLTPECTHLNLSIRQVSAEEVESLRNEDGGRYKSCEKCYKAGSMILFITDSGDRYHSDINCSGLKRDIMAIPISKVGNRGPCSRCGKGGE